MPLRRRAFLSVLTSPWLAGAAATLPGCSEKTPDAPPPPVVLPPFSAEAFRAGLDKLETAYAARFPRVRDALQPGLAEPQIREAAAWFPHALPPEVVALYTWRDGYLDPPDSRDPPFGFRDYIFLPLDRVQKEYARMMGTYGEADPANRALFASSFPIGSNGGGWLVVPAQPQMLRPDLARPVISVFQGVSVFFLSVQTMVETCADWVSHPRNDGFRMPTEVEMEVWRRHNPGLFAS